MLEAGAPDTLAAAWELFDRSGQLTDPKIRELLERYVTGFAAFCTEHPRQRL